jgi:hypothetical protein
MTCTHERFEDQTVVGIERVCARGQSRVSGGYVFQRDICRPDVARDEPRDGDLEFVRIVRR